MGSLKPTGRQDQRMRSISSSSNWPQHRKQNEINILFCSHFYDRIKALGFWIQCNAHNRLVIQKEGQPWSPGQKEGGGEEPINSHTHVAAAAAAEADVRITQDRI